MGVERKSKREERERENKRVWVTICESNEEKRYRSIIHSGATSIKSASNEAVNRKKCFVKARVTCLLLSAKLTNVVVVNCSGLWCAIVK